MNDEQAPSPGFVKPRRECARCGKTFSVNKDGKLQKHQGTERHPRGHRNLPCPGGNR